MWGRAGVDGLELGELASPQGPRAVISAKLTGPDGMLALTCHLERLDRTT